MRSQGAARIQRLGEYELGRRLATGGMAEVYEARRVGVHGFAKRFALKRILPQLKTDARMIEMFCDEARIHASLSHPNLVQVVDFGEHDGELFMAMEFVDGISVADLMARVAARRRTVALGAVLHIGREVLQGLAHAHAAGDDEGRALGIVHRDVAPSNILIGKNGEVKLGDFGIVRAALIESRTMPGEIKGKIGYVSPEQAMGLGLDARSDLFSLAVVLSEMLVGQPLFPGQTEFEILSNLHAGNLQVLEIYGRHVPDDVKAILRKALAHRPDDRFGTATEFSSALESAARRHGEELGAHVFAEWLIDLGLVAVRSTTHDMVERYRSPAATVPDSPEARGDRPSDVPFADEITLSAEEAEHPADSVPPELVHAAIRPKDDPRRRSGKHRIESDPDPSVTYRMRRLGGTIVGPLGLAPLLEMIATGRIGPEVELSRMGGPFLPASALGELSRLAARPAYRFHDPFGFRATDRKLVDRASLPRALFEIVIQRRSGLLGARNGREQKRLYFVDGALVFGASTDPDELLGARLLKAKLLERRELDRALERGWRRGRRLGEALIDEGYIRPSDLLRAVADQRRARLVTLCRWDAGELVFVDGAITGDDTLSPPGAPLGLVAGAVLEAYAAPELSRLLDAVRLVPLERAPNASRIESALSIPPPEAAALARLGQGHSLAEVLSLEGQYGLPDARSIERAAFVGLSAGVLWSSAWPRG